jgi:hypothetical protein
VSEYGPDDRRLKFVGTRRHRTIRWRERDDAIASSPWAPSRVRSSADVDHLAPAPPSRTMAAACETPASTRSRSKGCPSSIHPVGGAVTALDRISFSVAEGEFVAVVGPSGCGKSTLLKILAGLLPTSSGEAHLRGTPIAGPRRDIGVVFQSPVLLPWRSVLDNVLLPVDSPAARPGPLREGGDGPARPRRAHRLRALVVGLLLNRDAHGSGSRVVPDRRPDRRDRTKRSLRSASPAERRSAIRRARPLPPVKWNATPRSIVSHTSLESARALSGGS